MADIQIRGVRKSYGKTEVVHGIDLDVKDGSFVAILGPSGCGKSTLLRMIAGLEAVTAGEIAIGGRVVNRLEPRDRGCAMVFQNYALYPHMSVRENIGYALKVAGVASAERRRRVEEAAKTVGLLEFLDRRPGQLSGGQRQRVAMARAIIREPRVFLFDEPLSNLDAKLRAAMRLEIRRLHNRLGATSIFVTHDQVEALTLADVVVVMDQGRIEQIASPAEIYRQPASRFVANFIGSPPMNLFEGKCEKDRITLNGGGALPFDPTSYSIAPGRTIVAGVRPEDLRPANGIGGPIIPFTLEFIESLGPTQLLHGKTGSDDITLLVAGDASPDESTVEKLTALPAAVHLFDAETGLRLGRSY